MGDLDDRVLHTGGPSVDTAESIDEKIIGLLLTDGRATWTELAGQLSLPLSTVQRRGAALLQNGDVVVTVRATHEIIPPRSRVFECRVRCVPGAQRLVATALAKRSNTRWVAVITGEYDIALELVVPEHADYVDAMVETFGGNPDIVATESSMVIESFLVAENSTTGPLNPTTHVANRDCNGSHLDATDHAILSSLESNGRKTINEIAEETSLSRNTVRRRLSALLENGCAIVMAQARPSRTPSLPALIRMRIEPRSVLAVADALARDPRVRYVATLLGRSSLLCEYIPTSPGGLAAFVYDTLPTMHGIVSFEVEMIVANPKRGFFTFEN